MSKSLYEQMVEVVEYYETHKPLKTVTTKVLEHKTKKGVTINSDNIVSISDAFKAGESIKDYEEKVTSFNPKEELTKMIFGDAKPKLQQVSKFFEVCEKLTGGTITTQTEATSGKAKEELFKAELRAAQAKEQNVKSGKNKSVTLEQAEAEKLAVYTKYGKTYTPRKKADQ